jgi:hypothetical protein
VIIVACQENAIVIEIIAMHSESGIDLAPWGSVAGFLHNIPSESPSNRIAVIISTIESKYIKYLIISIYLYV